MMDPGGALFSRSEVLGGLPARRATTQLFAIESRTAHLVARSRRAMATFETERSAAEHEQAFLQAMAGARESRGRVRIQDIERYARSWGKLIPADPELRAGLVRRVADKYGLPADRVPRIRSALGAEDPAVEAAYLRQFGRPIADAFTGVGSIRDRLRWTLARASERLETLPPFWMAFALTLTETIAEGILAIPIAVAGIGVIPGLVLLVALGLINVVTVAALVESITRTGRMRYGEAYLGRLVSEYLGRSGSLLFGLALFVGGVVVLLAYALGFASLLGDATGIAPAVWVALLFAVNVAVLWRGTLDATVATALVIGAVNVVLILAICAIGLSHFELDRLLATDHAAPGGDLLALAFGVILLAYFGHASVANAAKVVLREDASGRALLAGSVTAMVVVVALYCLGVVAINGAVTPEALVEAKGTAFEPLAKVAGPSVRVLGSVYAMLAIGLGSVYSSLALYNQIRERLPTASSGGTGAAAAFRKLVGHPRGRWVVAMLPTIVIFAAVEAMVVLGAGNFVESLGIVGTLTVPLLAGVFPMLLLAAARRRGEFVPRPALRVIGHPLVVGAVSALFTAAVLVQGTPIWGDPLRRVLALVVGGATIAVTARALVRGAFRPRVVVELRVEGEQVKTVRVGLVMDGHAHRADAAWAAPGAGVPPTGAGGGPPRADEMTEVRVLLPSGHPSEVRVWSHVVGQDGESSPWPAAAAIATSAEPAQVVALDCDGIGDAASVADGATVTFAREHPDARVTRGRSGPDRP